MEETLKYWEPDVLSERHKMVATLIAAGWTNNEIAEEMGYSFVRISTLRNDPRIKAITRRIGEQLRQETSKGVAESIVKYSQDAVEQVHNLMLHAESESVRLTASRDILDRAGHKPRENVHVSSVHFSGSEVLELVKTLKEANEPEEELEFVEVSSGVFKDKNETVSARKG